MAIYSLLGTVPGGRSVQHVLFYEKESLAFNLRPRLFPLSPMTLELAGSRPRDKVSKDDVHALGAGAPPETHFSPFYSPCSAP